MIDCATKKVVGWATAEYYRTELIEAALRTTADTVTLAPDAIFHSDRGSNGTAGAFAAVIAELGIQQSVGRTGICYDNTMAESFFAAITNKWLHRSDWPNRAAARQAIIRYIEEFYNRRRLHPGLGYQTPQETENRYWKLQPAAQKTTRSPIQEATSTPGAPLLPDHHRGCKGRGKLDAA